MPGASRPLAEPRYSNGPNQRIYTRLEIDPFGNRSVLNEPIQRIYTRLERKLIFINSSIVTNSNSDMIYVMLFFGIFFISFGDGWCGCDFFSFFGMLLGCVASRELMDDVCCGI